VFPTGTLDRHLTAQFLLTDPSGVVIKEKNYKLKRTIMWRPFIIDLCDTRLVKNVPKEFSFSWKRKTVSTGSTLVSRQR
jgi:hypothetical protein